MNGTPQPQFERILQRSLVAGAAALVACGFGAYLDWTRFLQSYLVAYFFWLNISLGCFAVLMLHHMAGGRWGYIIRRSLEAGASTLPLMAVFFVPLLLGHSRLYPLVPDNNFKGVYLEPGFFYGRAAFYFAAWIGIASLLNKWSDDQDKTGDPALRTRLVRLSGPGILVFGFTLSFAAIDWVMSLQTDFFSTIYGMLFIVMAGLGAMSFVVVVTMLLSKHPPMSEAATPSLFHDHGNLLLTFVMLWAYLSFSQFLIIWAGNLQDEIPWYMTRARGPWGGVALFLIIFHFAIPFVLLLNRPVNKASKVLAGVAAALVVMGWVDLYWIIMPSFFPDGPRLNWMDFVAPIGLGGIWIAAFVWKLKSRSLLPLHDPRFEGVAENA